MNGKPVERVIDVWNGEPGSYHVKRIDGQPVALWFKMPTGTVGRIAAVGHGNPSEPEWELTEHEDGTVTAEPSIWQRAHARAGIQEWHGWLKAGSWSPA